MRWRRHSLINLNPCFPKNCGFSTFTFLQFGLNSTMSSEIATETRPTQKPLTVPLCLLNSFLSTTKHIQTPLEKFGRWVPIEIIIFIKLENIMSLYVYSSLTHLPPGKHHNWCPPPDFSHTIDPTHMILWFQWVPFHRSDSKLFPSAPAGVSLSLSLSLSPSPLGPPPTPQSFQPLLVRTLT